MYLSGMAVKNLKPELPEIKPADAIEEGQRILANIIARRHMDQTASRSPGESQSDRNIMEKKNEKLP
jgi:hypothetical protein